MTRNSYVDLICGALFGLILASTADAKLYLMFNVGDNEDREVPDAGTTVAEARDGIQPTVIDPNAERYVIHLPGATMDTLAGSATRVGNKSSKTESTITTAAAMSEIAGDATTVKETEGDTGWVEYSAFAASLMLFSPDGLDQESDIRFEPARVFLRRFADGSIYAAITAEDGDPPPQETTD